MKKLMLVILVYSSLCADQAAQNLQLFLLACYSQFTGDLKGAQYLYNQITPNQRDSQYVYLGYIPFLAASGSYSEIVPLIPSLEEPFQTNLEMQMLFALALEQTGKKNDAQTRYILLNEQNKTHAELTFKTAQIYLERAEPENAIKVIDNFLNASPRRSNNYIFHFMKSQIYVQLNKKPEALAAVKNSIEAYPKFDKSWLLYAVLHEQEGKLDQAIKGYSTFLEIAPGNSEIERHLLALAFRQKLANKKNPVSNPTDCLNQALTFFENKEYSKALSSIDGCLAQTPNDTHARLFKIQILAHQNQFDQAAKLLTQWILADADADLWLKTLHLLCYIGMPYKTALHALQTIEKQKGPSVPVILYQADLALRDTHQTHALPTLKKAYAMVKDPETKTKIAHQLGILYYDQGQWKLAQNILEEGLAHGYSYAPLNNLLAYIYATKGNDMARAIDHITKALAYDADNPHFLDTQALILYKQNKYDEAIGILQKVASVCPTDYTILNHLGKCYYKNGNTDRAMQSMKAAVKIAKNDSQKVKAESLITRWNKP